MVQQAVLSGIRVLSLEQVHVLPWGTAFLADFGAQVIRVESADHMNDRRSGPFPDGEPGDREVRGAPSVPARRGASGERAGIDHPRDHRQQRERIQRQRGPPPRRRRHQAEHEAGREEREAEREGLVGQAIEGLERGQPVVEGARTLDLELVLLEQVHDRAREVHDELGQLLSGFKFDLAWLEKKLSSDAETPRAQLLERVRRMGELLPGMMQSVRRIAAELRPGVLMSGSSPAGQQAARELKHLLPEDVAAGLRQAGIDPDAAARHASAAEFEAELTGSLRPRARRLLLAAAGVLAFVAITLIATHSWLPSAAPTPEPSAPGGWWAAARR